MNGVVEAICRIYANRFDQRPRRWADEWIMRLRGSLEGDPLTQSDLRQIDRELRAMKADSVQDRFSAIRDQLRHAEHVLETEGRRLSDAIEARIDLTGLQLDKPGALFIQSAPDASPMFAMATAQALRALLDKRGAFSTAVILLGPGETVFQLIQKPCPTCQALVLVDPRTDAMLCPNCRVRSPDVLAAPEAPALRYLDKPSELDDDDVPF